MSCCSLCMDEVRVPPPGQDGTQAPWPSFPPALVYLRPRGRPPTFSNHGPCAPAVRALSAVTLTHRGVLRGASLEAARPQRGSCYGVIVRRTDEIPSPSVRVSSVLLPLLGSPQPRAQCPLLMDRKGGGTGSPPFASLPLDFSSRNAPPSLWLHSLLFISVTRSARRQPLGRLRGMCKCMTLHGRGRGERGGHRLS